MKKPDCFAFIALIAAASLVAPSDAAKRMAAVAPETALRALATVDSDKLLSDRDYAQQVLANLDAAAPLVDNAPPEERRRQDFIRLLALTTLERPTEALPLAKRLTQQEPGDFFVYALLIPTALSADQPLEAIAGIESALRNLAFEQQRSDLRDLLSEDVIGGLRAQLRDAKDDGGRYRLAEALVELQWPNAFDSEALDTNRRIAIEGRVGKGDLAGARSLAAEITATRPLLRLLVERRFDPLFSGLSADRRVAASLAASDKATAAWLAAKPDDWWALTARIQFLRGTDRNAEAVALVMPRIADMAAVEKGGEPAAWTVNEAAYALLDAGRAEESVALMRKLLTLGVDEHGYLISMAINAGEIMNSAGRYDEAKRQFESLAAAPKSASAYGRMWIWEGLACANALSGNGAAAAPWLDKLKSGSADNRAAHMRGLLCANDLDGAEAALVARLDDEEDRASALLALQNYRQDVDSQGARQLIRQRLLALRERPAVKAAAERLGRILTLPLSQIYWGEV